MNVLLAPVALKTLAAPYLQGSLRPTCRGRCALPTCRGRCREGFSWLAAGFTLFSPQEKTKREKKEAITSPGSRCGHSCHFLVRVLTPPRPLPPHPLTAEPKITCTVTAHTYLCKYVFVRRLHFLLDRSTKATNGRRALKKLAVASDVTDVYDKRNLFK